MPSPPSSLPIEKHFIFVNGDFHSTVPKEKKGALQISGVKSWAPTATSDTQWKGERFSHLSSADSADVF